MSRPHPALRDLIAGRPVSDASGLVASAFDHRLGGLLLRAVEDGRADLRRSAALELVAADLATHSHHQRLWTALCAASDALGRIGIEVASLKGVTNEARWYGRLGDRPSGDVDLLVAPHHVDRIDEILAVLAPDYPTADEATQLVRARRLQHVHFSYQEVTVDLHLDPLKLGVWTTDPDAVWRSTTTIDSPGGPPVTVLSVEMALVGSLTHLNKDRFARLGGYDEIARILASSELDVTELRRIVTSRGLDVPVWRSLVAVIDELELDFDVPATRGWRAAVWDRLWAPSDRLGGEASSRRHRQRQAVLPLLMTGRLRDTVAEWRRLLLPPRSLLDVHAPELRDHGNLRRWTLDRLGHR